LEETRDNMRRAVEAASRLFESLRSAPGPAQR